MRIRWEWLGGFQLWRWVPVLAFCFFFAKLKIIYVVAFVKQYEIIILLFHNYLGSVSAVCLHSDVSLNGVKWSSKQTTQKIFEKKNPKQITQK